MKSTVHINREHWNKMTRINAGNSRPVIPILLSESHHHLTPSNVASKLTTLPHH